MRKKVTVEKRLCDKCKKEYPSYHCRNCEKEYCWKCKDTMGITYPFSLYFDGGDVGFYCHRCNAELEGKDNKLFNAYQKMRSLLLEYEAFHGSIKKREEVVEKEIQRLLDK